MSEKSTLGALLSAATKQLEVIEILRGLPSLEVELGRAYQVFNTIVVELLRRHADKLELRLDPKKGSWESEFAILVIRYGGISIRIKVEKIRELDRILYEELKLMSSIDNLFTMLAVLKANPMELTLQGMEVRDSWGWKDWQWAGLTINGQHFPLVFWHSGNKDRGVELFTPDRRYLRDLSAREEARISITDKLVVIDKPGYIQTIIEAVQFRIAEIQRQANASEVESRWKKGKFQVGDRARFHFQGAVKLDDDKLTDIESVITIISIEEKGVVVNKTTRRNTDSIGSNFSKETKRVVFLTWRLLEEFSPFSYDGAPYRDPYKRD